jgi:hypothetical protein
MRINEATLDTFVEHIITGWRGKIVFIDRDFPLVIIGWFNQDSLEFCHLPFLTTVQPEDLI